MDREARNLNMQSSELSQAESLEREAQMHRDRAMGAGNALPTPQSEYVRFTDLVVPGGHNSMESNADRRFNY